MLFTRLYGRCLKDRGYFQGQDEIAPQRESHRIPSPSNGSTFLARLLVEFTISMQCPIQLQQYLTDQNRE